MSTVLLVLAAVAWVVGYGLTAHAAAHAGTHARVDGAGAAGPRAQPGLSDGLDLAEEIAAVGWDAWAAAHLLRVVDVAPDPGSPGRDLTLVEVTAGPWTGTRIVQVVDASPNTRGVHERHGIPVPARTRTALAAVAYTFGLTATVYAPLTHT